MSYLTFALAKWKFQVTEMIFNTEHFPAQGTAQVSECSSVQACCRCGFWAVSGAGVYILTKL